jgi:hypothetical protein
LKINAPITISDIKLRNDEESPAPAWTPIFYRVKDGIVEIARGDPLAAD